MRDGEEKIAVVTHTRARTHVSYVAPLFSFLLSDFFLSSYFLHMAFRTDKGDLQQFYLHVTSAGHVQLHERVNRLCGGIHNVDNLFVRANLKVFAALLVHVRRAEHAEPLGFRGKCGRSLGNGVRQLRRLGDEQRRLVQHVGRVRLERDAQAPHLQRRLRFRLRRRGI